MKFERCVYERGYAGRETTPRMLAAAKRHLQRKADEVALFPELAPTETPEQYLRAFREMEAQHGREWRDHRAQGWRKARRLLEMMPKIQRRGILRYFEECSFLPKSPEYLLACITQATRQHKSFWRELRTLRIYKLVGAGKLPRSLILRPTSEVSSHG